MKKFYFLLLSFLALSLCANAEVLSIDFESASTAYTDWTFTNMTSQQNGKITAHGGTYYGTTGGKETASITTNSAIEAPQSITFYVSKQSTSTASSSWKLQVSSDNSNWTDVKTQSATSMTKGSWVKVTQDLSKYSNVYVRIYYTGSTAVRNIDDVELTVGGGEAVTVAKPTFSLASGTYYGTQQVEIQIPDGTEGVMYTTNGDVPSYTSETPVGELITENTPIPVSKTTTIKAIAIKGKNESAVAEATYTILPSIANTKETALTVAEAKNLIDNTSAEQLADPTQKVYVKGTISSITKLNSDNTITYLLDGDAFTIYRGKYLGEKTFASVDDLAVGASVIVYGNLYYYSATSLYEMNTGNYLVEYTAPAGFVEKPVITETSTPDFGYSYYTTSTATATIASATEGATIKYAITGVDVTDAATIESWTEGATVSITSEVAGTKILWAKAVKDGKESVVASKEFTFTTDVAPEGTYFVLVTDASQIVEGAKYVITDSECTAIANELTNGKYFSYSNGITDNGGVLTVDASTNYTYFKFENIADAADAYKWHMTFEDNDGSYKYLTSSTSSEKKDLKVAESAETADGVSISFSGNDAVISFKNSYTANKVQYRIRFNSDRFKTYGTSTGTTVYLYRLVKEVPVETTTGLDKVISGKVGRKYQINTPLCVNYKDDKYVYASTTKGGFTKTAPTEAQKKEWWSDKEDGSFNQNDWVAIQGLDVVEGAEIEAGSIATLVSNSEFPVIKFDSMKTADGTAIAANTYRVANFNIGNVSPLVSKLWLVAPQPAEYCKVKGYVDVADVKASYLFAQTGSEATVIEGTSYDPLNMRVNLADASTIITTSGWYVFEGVVVKGSTSLQLNAISAKEGSIETGVEGVEASSVKVYGAEGVINVVSEEVASIAVYSANGAIVSSVEASSASIAVAPGFYIVKAGNSVSKVTVK